jgi:hypothetical protein
MTGISSRKASRLCSAFKSSQAQACEVNSAGHAVEGDFRKLRSLRGVEYCAARKRRTDSVAARRCGRPDTRRSDAAGGVCPAAADAERTLDRRTVQERGCGWEAAAGTRVASPVGWGTGESHASLTSRSVLVHGCAEWRFPERAIRLILARSALR